MRPNIVIVDDDPHIVRYVKRGLDRLSAYEVRGLTDRSGARDRRRTRFQT